MKSLFYILFFLFTVRTYAQTDEINNSILTAEKAIENKEYKKAIAIYKELSDNYKFNPDFLFNLANLYFITDNIENACECLYNAAILNDKEAVELIESKCQTYKNGKVKLLQQVDSPPKFLYQSVYHNLIENNVINPIYIDAIKYYTKGKKYLPDYLMKYIEIDVKIDERGNFIGKIDSFDYDNTEINLIKNDLEKILKTNIKYKPAIYKGESVEIFENYSLTLL
ncbi:hypothetical protein [uncultured Flavobacterium sp.]|uniref:hypothetical protein n=1 Tax=uncultured Flavobacterium sp. TaxID=165435 RepID=UPI0030C86D6C